MYNVGMYGGTFNPLHQGHVKCIVKASTECKELHIILSHGINRNELDVKIRYRWIYLLTKHMSNVKIHIVTDNAKSKGEYTEEYWQEDAEKIKELIGKPIDIIFCGSDYNEESFYNKCYKESEIKYLLRDDINSTKIRSNPYKYWDWIPNVVKPYYVKKVLLIGGESAGKSTLTVNLANYYNTNYLEEMGREISIRSGTDKMMLSEDYVEILLRHKIKEIELIEKSNKILIEDTDALITKFYIGFLENKRECDINNERLADAISFINKYDLVLFLEPDVEFVQDGTRNIEIQENRNKYSNDIKEIFKNHNINYISISGNYRERFLKAIKEIDNIV